ncbi:hypothetical protein J6590_052625 [Homalodisca vitripennis]|nr:hypothetical protein J6590_052625 [Homalodisca vitripennis]
MSESGRKLDAILWHINLPSHIELSLANFFFRKFDVLQWSVQNKFLRYLHWREPDRPLNLLRLHPLVVRRERIAFRLPSGTRSRRLFELSHLNRNYLQFSSVPRMLRLGNEVCSEVDFFCNRLGALRRAVLTVRLETFESE